MAVWIPSCCASCSSRPTKAGCIRGSPPETVRPPPVVRKIIRYLFNRFTKSSSRTGWPLAANMVSGLWQYRQRNGQPERKTVIRVPGPSTPVTSSQECMDASSPERTCSNLSLRSRSSVMSMPATPKPPDRNRGTSNVAGWGRYSPVTPSAAVDAVTWTTQEPWWKVRDSTSRCCSLVSLTKFTA